MKTVLVTGSSRGIGAAIARSFAENGFNTVINYRSSKEQAEMLCRELTEKGCKVIAAQADVSKKSDVDRMFAQILAEFGTVDVLVNNAGISSIKMLCDVTEDEWDATMNVNLKSAYLCINAASAGMVHNKWGRIVNISSIWGIRGASCEAHYSASKAALVGLTKAMAKELAPSGITVNCVSPGLIDTEMNGHLTPDEIRNVCEEIPLGYVGKPSDIANAVLFLADEISSYITGQTLCVDGGWSL